MITIILKSGEKIKNDSVSLRKIMENISLTPGSCLTFEKDGRATGIVMCSEIAAVFES